MERDHGRGTGVISNQLSGLLVQSLQLQKQPQPRGKEKSQQVAGDMKLSEDFSAIYLFQSPLLYFRFVPHLP